MIVSILEVTLTSSESESEDLVKCLTQVCSIFCSPHITSPGAVASLKVSCAPKLIEYQVVALEDVEDDIL